MRLPVPCVLSLLLLGGCLPDERQAAAGLEVIYKARPGCIIVLARDAKKPHGEASVSLEGDKLDNKRARIAVFRQEDWSHTLELITTAHEQSCKGAVVARDKRQVQLSSSDVVAISITLDVTDEDGDGYMPVAQEGALGGTDCHDGQPNTHPNAAELCDEQDNNCDGDRDEGLDTRPWYADQDGDGFGDQQGLPVQSCKAPAGRLAYVSTRNDCDDLRQDIHPGAPEACDHLDNDCDGSSDEDLFAWYPDKDADGFGDIGASPVMSCAAPPAPPAYVQDATDCQDLNRDIHPRPGASEARCDDVDDDCDGVVDDGFAGKGAGCNGICPNGRLVCNPRGDGLICESPNKIPVYPDMDADGAGSQSDPSRGEICPDENPPPGTASNMDDCDDQDPHNRRLRAEACDERDNTCDGVRDEGNVCGGKRWGLVNDEALMGNRQWRTVALGLNGGVVWTAGVGGVLAVRLNAGQAFTTKDGSCGGHNWNAAWVRPSDGRVFLAGSGGFLAEHRVSSCNTVRVPAPHPPNLTGLVGFESNGRTTIYAVSDWGQLYVWTPGNAPVRLYDITPPTHFGIHGRQSKLLTVGGAFEDPDDPRLPYIASHPGIADSAVVRHTLRGVEGYEGEVRAVWMAPSGLAYAVGDNGLVMKWDGAEAWDRVPLAAGSPPVKFTSVVALDSSSIYVAGEHPGGGFIARLTTSGWADHPRFIADRPLRDLALDWPGEIWAVGDDGRVMHFPH